MKILLINQCFFPDVVSTAQHLTDLALKLAERGHEVTVIASRRGYSNPGQAFPKKESWKGIRILRIPSSGFGKGSRLSRVLDFGTFLFSCALRMLLLPGFHAVVALTSPPLISALAAAFTRLKGGRFLYWVMDMNPDEAIAAGWLKESSLTARLLSGLADFSSRQARRVVVLDRFMKERLTAKGVPENRISIVPPWAHDAHVAYSAAGRSAFRKKHNLSDKFLVMYSGNHSPCHPLDTLLEAASALSSRPEIHFCFVGGGSEYARAQHYVYCRDLHNVTFLPYQPMGQLAGLLSAADLHVITMGDAYVGIVHPCKIYNVLTVGAPFLFIGPERSHLADIVAAIPDKSRAHSIRHGDVPLAIKTILEAHKLPPQNPSLTPLARPYSMSNLIPTIIQAIEGASAPFPAFDSLPAESHSA